MYCMCLPAFFVPSADKSQLWVIYAITNILPVAICCCLDTCNVYVVLYGAIYCCLHTCCVYVVLSELYYVCTPTFIATIAMMGQL